MVAEQRHLRVLIVGNTWDSSSGGTGTFHVQFSTLLATHGVDVVSLLPRTPANLRNWAAAKDCSSVHGVYTREVTKNGYSLPTPMQPINDSVESKPGISLHGEDCGRGTDLWSPDIVIGHGHVTGVVAMEQAKLLGVPCAIVLHAFPLRTSLGDNSEWEETKFKRVLGIATDATCTLIIAIGPRLYESWAHRLPADATRHKLVRYDPWWGTPTDIQVASTSGENSWRDRFREAMCVVVTRQGAHGVKGIATAVSALESVNESIRDGSRESANEITLSIRGTGVFDDDKALFAEYSERADIAICDWLPHRDFQRDLAKSCSVLLFPSHNDGYGLVAMEAIALGIPVIISKESGIGMLLSSLCDDPLALRFVITPAVDTLHSVLLDMFTSFEAYQTAVNATCVFQRCLVRHANEPVNSLADVLRALGSSAKAGSKG